MKLKGPSANDDVIDNVPAKASGEKTANSYVALSREQALVNRGEKAAQK